MNDVSVIDRFLDVFSRYIDSGFGLVQGEVAFLTATLIVIDMTLAGLFWAMGHATGQGEDVIAKLIRKVLYVGAFAYIIGNFNTLAGILFRSFAGLGLTASGSTLSMGNFLQPGRLAKAGIDAAAPILDQIREMAGFPEVFINIAPIVVLFLAWLVVIVSFFVLAVQLFVTLIEFKLTTLAGFVLVPFALWNKTAFLVEKVLGNVVSSGIKVLVLAVIVGAAWLFRRVSMGGMLGRWQPAKVVSGVMVGPHERVVIVELEGQWLVLGVTAKQVNLLISMARPEGAANAATVPAATPPFAEWLAAALAKHRRPSSNDTP